MGIKMPETCRVCSQSASEIDNKSSILLHLVGILSSRYVHLGLAHESRDPLVHFCRIQGTGIPTQVASGTVFCSCHILLRNYSFAVGLYHFEFCADTWLMDAADSALLCEILNSSVGLVSE